MSKIALLLSLFLSPFLVLGQNDPQAKKVIDAFGQQVKASKGIQANLKLVSISSKGRNTGTKSLGLSMRGDKYRLQQGKVDIVCDGKTVYNYDGNKTITKSPVEEGAQTLSPQKLLAGSYDKDFTYKLVSSKGGFNEIELLPIDKRKNFQKVNLFFSQATKALAKARILDKSNNITELVVSSLNLKANLAESVFVFNRAAYPKDAEILD
ncbi:MAG: outer membrane lipoprotein carrier protein LolA [Sphingobacteriia bacterium]|nr:MAG: outer membrane lipoprotein carrier protein LolA [Sphingobacteriia bacterium]